jgi:H/ACA ribonucleoprotein complex subunit 3
MTNLFYCKKCKVYTLEKKCKNCGNKTIIKHPPRYSPQDRYGRYRRKLKKMDKMK